MLRGPQCIKLLALRPHHGSDEATDPVAVLPMPQACAAPSAFSPGSREGAATAEWRVRRWRLRGPGSGRRARRRVLRHRNGQSVAPQPRAHHFPPPARFPRPHQSHSFLYHARPLIGHLFACPVRVLSGIESRSIARRPGASKDGASSWRAASRQLARERDPGSCPRRGQRRSRRWSGTLAHEVSRTPPLPDAHIPSLAHPPRAALSTSPIPLPSLLSFPSRHSADPASPRRDTFLPCAPLAVPTRPPQMCAPFRLSPARFLPGTWRSHVRHK